MSIQRVIHIAANQRSPGAGAGRGVGGRIINKRHRPAKEKKRKKNGRKGCGGGGGGGRWGSEHRRGHSALRGTQPGRPWAPQTLVGLSSVLLAREAAPAQAPGTHRLPRGPGGHSPVRHLRPQRPRRSLCIPWDTTWGTQCRAHPAGHRTAPTAPRPSSGPVCTLE